MRTLVLITAALLTTAAATASAHKPADGSVVVAGYRLYPAPARLASQCKRARQHVRFLVLCPTVMPRTGDGTTTATASPLPPGDAGVAPTTFAQWGGYPANVTASWLYVGGVYGGGETDPGDWQTNNPNYFFHFFVLEGHLTPTQLDLAGPMSHQRLLTTRTIGGHRGRLYTQISYSLCNGGCSFTGHLTFIWQHAGITYAASLHRWSANPRDPAILAILSTLIAHLRPVN